MYVQNMFNVVHKYMVTPIVQTVNWEKNFWSLGKYGSCHRA